MTTNIWQRPAANARIKRSVHHSRRGTVTIGILASFLLAGPGCFSQSALDRYDQPKEAAGASISGAVPPGIVPFDLNKKFSGVGVIEKIYSTGPELEFRADGFRVRVPAGAAVSFRDTVKSAADVSVRVWVRFSGKFDRSGVLAASQADFTVPKVSAPARRNAQPSEDSDVPRERSYVPAAANIVNQDGTLGELLGKFRFKEDSGWYRLTDDAAMQERVQELGVRVIPSYQKNLQPDDPAKVRFRFYVVEQGWIREPIFGASGVTLIPRPVVERLKRDDELASVLADGVAYHMQMQKSDLMKTGLESAAEAAGVLAMAMMETSVMAAGGVAKGIYNHEQRIRMEEERGRMVLGLLADAGFDPWQAPEAWRILQPNKARRDLEKVKYPARCAYQLRMLAVQYPQNAGAEGATAN